LSAKIQPMVSRAPDLETRIDCFTFNFDRMIKKNMFGGRGYLLNGNFCFGTYQDKLVLRTSRRQADELLKLEYIQPFVVTGRTRKGWLMIGLDYFKSDEKLNEMLEMGIRYVSRLRVKPC
jgi:TfoX/Sxy family transcriptional regulator of competence genes